MKKIVWARSLDKMVYSRDCINEKLQGSDLYHRLCLIKNLMKKVYTENYKNLNP